jgi:transposase InsO family protein
MQFTSEEFTRVLRDHGIAISMDGRGRCHDNIFVERGTAALFFCRQEVSRAKSGAIAEFW